MKDERESQERLWTVPISCVFLCLEMTPGSRRLMSRRFRSRWCRNSKCQEQSTVRAPCGKRCRWAGEEHSPLIHPLPCSAYRQIKCQVSACLTRRWVRPAIVSSFCADNVAVWVVYQQSILIKLPKQSLSFQEGSYLYMYFTILHSQLYIE